MTTIDRITSPEELDRALERSREVPVWIFKHSLTCSISGAALAEFQRFVERLGPDSRTEFRLIEIQHARPVSAETASRTGVTHESPQAILVVGGDAVWHESHWGIRLDALEAAEIEAAARPPAP